MTPTQVQALAHQRSAEAQAAQKRENAAYRVEIVRESTGEVEHSMPSATLRSAQQLERGVNINLDHERYYTRIATGATP